MIYRNFLKTCFVYITLSVIPRVLALSGPFNAYSADLKITDSLLEEIVSEPYPAIMTQFFVKAPYKAEDFQITWKAGTTPLSGVTFRLLQGSLQWIRTKDFLVLPRATLEVIAHRDHGEGYSGGLVSEVGFSQALSRARVEDKLTARMPVALVSSLKNEILVTLHAGNQELKGILVVKFVPRAARGDHIFFDSSCSPYSMKARLTKKTPLQPSGYMWAVGWS